MDGTFCGTPYILVASPPLAKERLPGPSGRVAPVSGSVEAESVIEHVHPPLWTTPALLGLFLVVRAVQLAHLIALAVCLTRFAVEAFMLRGFRFEAATLFDLLRQN